MGHPVDPRDQEDLEFPASLVDITTNKNLKTEKN